ncbi:MAG: hypothetical protein FWH05_00340 [Oscillospiraceae bacterium]|nr:hypothetical protein [Oscillospiraceae bacterium]
MENGYGNRNNTAIWHHKQLKIKAVIESISKQSKTKRENVLKNFLSSKTFEVFNSSDTMYLDSTTYIVQLFYYESTKDWEAWRNYTP